MYSSMSGLLFGLVLREAPELLPAGVVRSSSLLPRTLWPELTGIYLPILLLLDIRVVSRLWGSDELGC